MINPPWPRRYTSFAVFAFYATLSIIFIDHGASITRNVLGISSDPFLFTWFLSWWPWAFAHHFSLLHTNLVWQPEGLQIFWTTCVPLLALAAAPITLFWGPAPAYNLLILSAPVLSAGTAYLLALRLTHRRLAALIAGYLFGFSTYEMSETLAHLNLAWNFLLPLVALATLERLQDGLSRTRFIVFIVLLLVLQFYISVEIFATLIFFSGVTWLLAIFLLPDLRTKLHRLVVEGVIAAPFVLLLTSPLLWPMLMEPRGTVVPTGWSYVCAAHLLNLLSPTPETVLASPQYHSLGNSLFGLPESDVTTGLPVLIILWLYARENWRSVQVQFIYMLLAIILLASLGPQLWAGPVFTRFVLPWWLMLNVPLIASALPVRFALYASLIAALLVAFWVAADPPARCGRRIGIGVITCLIQLPSPHPVIPLPQAAFFAPGNVQQRLGFQARLLILPEKNLDISPFWQAENKFGFSQTMGYLGVPPQSAQSHLAVDDMMFGWKSAHLGPDVAELCFATKTQFVIASPGTQVDLLQAMKGLSWPEKTIDGMMVFTVPPAPNG